jgi:chromosomal replication initiator protein
MNVRKSLIIKHLELAPFLSLRRNFRYNKQMGVTAGQHSNPVLYLGFACFIFMAGSESCPAKLVGFASMPTRSVLVRFLATPENRSAVAAIQDLLFGLSADATDRLPNPLFLHGPSGSGKTYLVQALAEELTNLGIDVCSISANDFAGKEGLRAARQADLLIVEDLQHLPTRYVETLVQHIDERLRRGSPMIFTALQGPSGLKHRGTPLPGRLTNRLAGGLVVALAPMQTPSRRRLLKVLAEQMKLNVGADILDWLAEQLTGGGRQLEGAIRQLKTLQRLQSKPLRLADIRAHFRIQIEAKAPTVKRIAEHVSGYFHVEVKLLPSAGRSRDVLLPRQVSMYLARQLTSLSLQKIGKFFGGRDHKTVQHACKKIEAAMKVDAALSGAVRRMHAELA